MALYLQTRRGRPLDRLLKDPELLTQVLVAIEKRLPGKIIFGEDVWGVISDKLGISEDGAKAIFSIMARATDGDLTGLFKMKFAGSSHQSGSSYTRTKKYRELVEKHLKQALLSKKS